MDEGPGSPRWLRGRRNRNHCLGCWRKSGRLPLNRGELPSGGYWGRVGRGGEERGGEGRGGEGRGGEGRGGEGRGGEGRGGEGEGRGVERKKSHQEPTGASYADFYAHTMRYSISLLMSVAL